MDLCACQEQATLQLHWSAQTTCCASAFLSRFLKSSLLHSTIPKCGLLPCFSPPFLSLFFFSFFLVQMHHLFTNHIALLAARNHPTGCVGKDIAAGKENVTLLQHAWCALLSNPHPAQRSFLPFCCPQSAVYPCATTTLDLVERCDGSTDGIYWVLLGKKAWGVVVLPDLWMHEQHAFPQAWAGSHRWCWIPFPWQHVCSPPAQVKGSMRGGPWSHRRDLGPVQNYSCSRVVRHRAIAWLGRISGRGERWCVPVALKLGTQPCLLHGNPILGLSLSPGHFYLCLCMKVMLLWEPPAWG